MKWIIDNWSLLVVVACVGVSAYVYIKKFLSQPTAEQLNKIREWLLYAVVEAEKTLGSGTGTLKLRYVYSMFIDKFPAMVDIISFELFSKLVDEVLTQMKHLLESNIDIASYAGVLEDKENKE